MSKDLMDTGQPIAMLGLGTMGHGIALTIAAAGYRCAQRSGDGSTSNQGPAS